MISSMVNPHDVMYLAEEGEFPGAGDNALFAGALHHSQDMHMTRAWWDPELPANFEDDLSQQPYGPKAYKQFVEDHYTTVPDEDRELWKKRRNYLINCMRMVDAEFGKIVDELDRQDLWENTVVIFTSDHGEMNAAHKMHQKGGIPFQEATVVNMTAVVPGGAQGVRTSAVGSHLDLTPTVLAFAGVDDERRQELYPALPGRDLSKVFTRPEQATAPRGTAEEPGDGALLMWDGLHQQDPDWTRAGGMKGLLNLPPDPQLRTKALLAKGQEMGAPDLAKRTFFRAVVDGRYKLVRWFSPLEYGAPTSVDELYETSDVTLHDLVADPDEMENLGNPEHPQHDPQLVDRLLVKLNALIERELGTDACPMDLDMFGTRDVLYGEGALGGR
ncbi:sulfatase-like hydrolase/transferase [Luteococcus sp. Sow4_B9]|uniref:sulfatase-like hydrolase/transferase n=1 Tax=Luteococcus sp. Sow4_B9 TaxID=3438792 RepID=UPI003F9AA30D